MKLLVVKGIKERNVLVALFALKRREYLPKHLEVRARSFVFGHCGNTLPHRADHLGLLVAKRRDRLSKQRKISAGEFVKIHRQQRAVQVK